MNDENEKAATAALALGTVFADEELRASVNKYVQEQVMHTIFDILHNDHPLMRQIAGYIDSRRYPENFERRRYEEMQRERMERQRAERTLAPKIKMPKF